MNKKKMQMDFIERVTLSPFEKYVRFNRFPWKFIFHLLLVILSTYQALKIVSIQDKHTRVQEQVFSTIYLQNEDGTSNYPYYSLVEFSDTFFGILEETETLNQTLLQYSQVDDVTYRMQVYYTENNPEDHLQYVYEGNSDEFISALENIPLHEENYTEMKDFIQEVENIQINIQNVITYISIDSDGKLNQCLNWTIYINYDFQSFANVEGSLEAEPFECYVGEDIYNEESIISVHIAILFISICSLIASWKQVYTVSREYRVYKKAMITSSKHEIQGDILKTSVDWRKNWEDLGFFDKMKFFDFWFIVIVTGNFFQLLGALVAILDEIILTKLLIFQHKEILIGFGVMLAWITMLKYIEYNENFNVMTSTLSKSWGNLLMFLLGVMPFFLGFVFLGQTIFWKYNKFEDTSSSVVTLFSLLNGDIVNDTFLQTWAEGLVGQIYLIIFMILFYTAVQNVFVTIIMEGYEESIKQKQYKRLLEEKQQKDKAQLQENLMKIEKQQEQEIFQLSPQLTPEQLTGMNRIKLNGRKVDRILSQIERVGKEINQSQLHETEKQYLKNLICDNLDSVYRTVKMQLNEIQKQQ